MTEFVQETLIEDLSLLNPGDEIEARRDGVRFFRGRVEETAPSMSVLWIRSDGLGERRLLHLEDFSLWRCAPASHQNEGVSPAASPGEEGHLLTRQEHAAKTVGKTRPHP